MTSFRTITIAGIATLLAIAAGASATGSLTAGLTGSYSDDDTSANGAADAALDLDDELMAHAGGAASATTDDVDAGLGGMLHATEDAVHADLDGGATLDGAIDELEGNVDATVDATAEATGDDVGVFAKISAHVSAMFDSLGSWMASLHFGGSADVTTDGDASASTRTDATGDVTVG